MYSGGSSLIEGNLVTEIEAAFNAIGILPSAPGTEVRNNVVSSTTTLDYGVWNELSSADIICRDNTVLNALDAFNGCLLIGTNQGVDGLTETPAESIPYPDDPLFW
jgi:hypothetical protein